MMTPYDKLKSLDNAEQYLRKDVTFEQLDDIANAMTDNGAAQLLQPGRQKLFRIIHETTVVSA